MNPAWKAASEQRHFMNARRKAFLGALLDLVRRQPNDLLKFEDVRVHLNIRGQHALGRQAVPLDSIIGSEGRSGDFDRRFYPRATVEAYRWSSIDRAMIKAVELPPVELYKIGDVYFVRDGNHRISVARQNGQAFIDAFVTELLVDVPLSPDFSIRDLLYKEEYSDFLEWTDLHQLRPDERIEFSELGGYLDLVRHINAHRFWLAQRRDDQISRDEAVTDWYDTVYTPIVQLIREHNMQRYFPGRTEADLYRWVMDQCEQLCAGDGAEPDIEQAVRMYIERYAHADLAGSIANVLRGALQAIGWRQRDTTMRS
jgi:hypothetical protein